MPITATMALNQIPLTIPASFLRISAGAASGSAGVSHAFTLRS